MVVLMQVIAHLNCFTLNILILEVINLKRDFPRRSDVKAGKDKAVFARTARKSKKINVDPKNYRGGIRL